MPDLAGECARLGRILAAVTAPPSLLCAVVGWPHDADSSPHAETGPSWRRMSERKSVRTERSGRCHGLARKGLHHADGLGASASAKVVVCGHAIPMWTERLSSKGNTTTRCDRYVRS